MKKENVNTESVNSDLLFKDVIDYDLSIGELLLLGNYDAIDCSLSALHDSRQESGQKEIIFEIIDFSEERGVEMNSTPNYFKENKIRPATSHELIFFGAKHPEAQKNFLIHSLSPGHRKNTMYFKNHLCLGYLQDKQKRVLFRSYFQNFCRKDVRFLAVHLS